MESTIKEKRKQKVKKPQRAIIKSVDFQFFNVTFKIPAWSFLAKWSEFILEWTESQLFLLKPVSSWIYVDWYVTQGQKGDFPFAFILMGWNPNLALLWFAAVVSKWGFF